MTKRAVDLLVVLLASPIWLPLAAGVALAVRSRLGRPVLFVQERPGLKGRPFRMYKFRTMSAGVDAEGQPLPDVQRLSPFGRLLRSTSLDELPELWNVLRGDMSLVGPRPLLMEYLPRYSARQARRHEVRPGITGWAQVNGRNGRSWGERFELDIWYVENRSLLLDLRILMMTIGKVLRREGITEGASATMTKFTGGDGCAR